MQENVTARGTGSSVAIVSRLQVDDWDLISGRVRNSYRARFESFTAVKTEFVVFGVIVPRSVVIGYHLFNPEDGGSTILREVVSNHLTTQHNNPENHKF
jgi:hypothetical protein